MLRALFLAVITAFAPMAGAGPAAAASEAVTFPAPDQVQISASYLGTGDRAAPIILLFHQAGGNRGEYASIAPRLVALGFNTLSVDQRSGGTANGVRNETAARIGRNVGFLEALPDLKGAVDWARASGHTGKIIVWGSSYSASLVFLLAAEDARVAAVIAFSPGEYFSETGRVARAAARVRQPILVSSASDSGEIREAAALLAAAPAVQKIQIRPKSAGHGSSALNGSASADTWREVERFLAGLR